MAVKPSQYAPSFIVSALRGSRATQMTYDDVTDTNFMSTSSFYYDVPGSPLKSSQQLNVDWSKFENHVFFSSAEVKVCTAFDQIVNKYPFDGTACDIEKFFENLTGFDNWVFEQFPKYKGALRFSGSYIIVNDFAGGLFPTIDVNKSTGHSVLNPGESSFSIEAQVFIPSVSNDNQVICAKFENDHGFMLALSSSASTSTCQLMFLVGSGTMDACVYAPVSKGTYNHVCAIFDRETANNVALLYVNEELVSRSQTQQYFGSFQIDETPFYVGTGSFVSAGQTSFLPQETFSGSLDELRIFHSIRSQSAQRSYARKAITSTDDLKLYYRFNEPPPPLTSNVLDLTNAIVVDSSGHALHATVNNFTGTLRIESSQENNPMIYEKDISAPVLFTGYTDVISLNETLLASASAYDQVNPNIITRLIPEHYLLDSMQYDGLTTVNGDLITQYSNAVTTRLHDPNTSMGSTQLLLSLMYILARFFDEIKLFVDAFSTVHFVDYDNTDTVPDTFLPRLMKRMGFDVPPMFTDASVQQYIDAENIDYNISTSTYPLKYVQNQLLRNVLLNLRTIIQSKGTQHSIKAFLRAIGIDPDNSMRFREYGGPTSRTLDFARERKYDVSTMVKFTSESFAYTPFLSGSRTEVGFPTPVGTMVDIEHHNPHGISNAMSDGLFTSGSWTYEITVKFLPEQMNVLTGTQSVGRLCCVSSSGETSVLSNMVITVDSSGSWTPGVYFSVDSNIPPLYLYMSASAIAIDENEKWRLSCGCTRDDATGSLSSSYFLRVGKCDAMGDIEFNYTTASYFQESYTTSSINPFRTLSAEFSPSGTFIAIGNNQAILSGSSMAYLNNDSISPDARATELTCLASNLRFWSKAITDNEWREHVRNYKSAGVEHPLTNYNFTHVPSGAFERLRLDTLSKQDVLCATAAVSGALTGNIIFIDYSQNLMHMTGSGFDATSNCLTSEIFYYSYVSPYFDENSNDIKVRARGFLDINELKEAPWAAVAPVYETVKSEQPTDDTRFVIEFSLIDAVNRDIITMFGTLDEMNNILGNPELLYSPDYPDLERLQDIYFQRLSSKLNFKSFFEFYRWFDQSIGTFIEQLVPRKTRFKGTHYTIESHMLERHKLRYLSDTIYLGDSNRDNLDGQILLQMFDCQLRKY